MTETLRLLILFTLIVLSLEERRTGVGPIGGLNERSRTGGVSTEPRPQLSREVPSSSTQEAEYVYEYYDEPDYQHYPPKPKYVHHHHDSILDTLQGRRVNYGSGNVPTVSTAPRANILTNRERYSPSTSTKRPAHLHAQLSRLIPTISNESRDKFSSSTEAPAEEDQYEYVYEDGEPAEPPLHRIPDPPREHPSKEIETKVSVSVSASQHTSTPLPKSLSPESGIVISVATTRSISSRLNPIPQTTPSTPQPSTTPNLPSFLVPRAASPVIRENPKIVPEASNSFSKPDRPTSSTVETVPKPVNSNTNGRQTTSSSTTSSPEGIKFQDVSRFLPPDYKKPPPVQSLLPKIQFQEVVSHDFLPKDYVLSTVAPSTVPSTEPSTVSTTTTTTTTTTTAPTTTTTVASTTTTTAPPTQAPTPVPLPLDPLQALMNKIRFKEDVSLLLPPGYKEKSLLPPGYLAPTESTTSTTTNHTPPSSTLSSLPALPTSTLPGKVVFPTRAGGVKSIRPTTSESPKAETPAPPKVALKAGWPTRKTTEFTGWPTVPTTPMTTTTTTSTTTTPPPSTEPTTTTERTTTTMAPPKRNPVTLCEASVCKMEATLRITGGVRWKPEYADINTEEWKHLENTVKRELDGAYRSSGLAPFYRSIEIEAFNEGSVVVDYFVLLDNVDREISSEQIRSLFHATLLQTEEPFEKDRLRLGRYSIDPRYTDFKARTFESEGVTGELEEALIPQWGIAVIVIGLASLLFVIIFAVTLMVSKQRKGGKKSGVSLTQEMLNEFNKRSLGSNGGESSVRREDLYHMEDAWDESHLERTLDLRSGGRSSLSNKEGYNIYDSWKTEWNGYNHHFGKGGDSSTRRRADYDTNF